MADYRTTAEILTAARDGGYAVGAFNISNMETAQAVVRAAVMTASPVILQITESTLAYAGAEMITHIAQIACASAPNGLPIAIHLDHGKSVAIAHQCIDLGFSSVMIDCSRQMYAENVAATQAVVSYAHERGVSVQAELGNVPYTIEAPDGVVSWDPYMTDPEQAAAFVAATHVDTLAIAIGNAHGDFVERPTPDFDRLAAIRAAVSVPLVMHGASDWDASRVQEAIARGVSCFNVDTYLRQAFTASLATYFADTHPAPQPRVYLGAARDAVMNAVCDKMRLFGSCGKARMEAAAVPMQEESHGTMQE